MSRHAIVVLGVFCTLTAMLAAAAPEQPGLKPAGDSAGDAIREVRTPSGLAWQVPVVHDGVRLVVTGPEEYVHERWFEPVETVSFETAGLPDGQYRYELRVAPMVDASTRLQMREARETGDDSIVARLKVAGLLPTEPVVRSGSFRILGESVVAPTDTEPAREQSSAAASEAGSDRDVSTKDQVILDDLIVDGSLCVGFDCVNGESFGFDTIRLKENNLRIRFLDTSNSASFPTNDWQLTANDSTNGGANKFSIDDIDGGRTPFTIEARAPNHSLFIDDGGRLGLKTAAPLTEIHSVDGDTPTLRLDQQGGGWAPQIWDVAGNETNFFVRDVTNGSRLPFRIQPGAPTSSLHIANSGNVGVGTPTPDAPLEIETTGQNAELRLTRTDAPADSSWSMTTEDDGRLVLKAAGSSTSSLSLGSSGAVTAAGPVNALSDRNAKRDFAPVDPAALLARLATLEIAEWSYATEGGVRHIGPTSQDFRAVFGIGSDDRHITLSDLGGVALAAIQALSVEIEDRDRQIRALEARLVSLEERLGPAE
jgi:hypothetical protein